MKEYTGAEKNAISIKKVSCQHVSTVLLLSLPRLEIPCSVTAPHPTQCSRQICLFHFKRLLLSFPPNPQIIVLSSHNNSSLPTEKVRSLLQWLLKHFFSLFFSFSCASLQVYISLFQFFYPKSWSCICCFWAFFMGIQSNIPFLVPAQFLLESQIQC